MLEASKDKLILKKAIQISRVPDKFRNGHEISALTEILKQFDIFNKISEEQRAGVLLAASTNVRFMKVPQGQFLYHRGEPSSNVYFILKGEAWKFRPKTDLEVERELNYRKTKKNQSAISVPKILETIRLARASKEREVLSLNQTSLNSIDSTRAGTLNSLNQNQQVGNGGIGTIPSLNTGGTLNKIVENCSLENSINTSVNEFDQIEKELNKTDSLKDIPNPKLNLNSAIKKIMSKRDVLNFEDDYFYNLVKRDEQLSIRYLDFYINTMRFEKKFNKGETVGELSGGLNYNRTSSVLAYTSLYVLYLDQKGYENTFTNQIEAVRDKVNFFANNYFKDTRYDLLKRMCFFFKEQKFKLGDIIYRQGSPCSDLYFIKSGQVELNKKVASEETLKVGYEKKGGSLIALDSDPKKSRKYVVVASIIDGCFFGEEVLFDQMEREFTAKSKSNLTCYKITSKILSKLPKDMIKKLQELSSSKQEWRGERIQNIKTTTDQMSSRNFLNTEYFETPEDGALVCMKLESLKKYVKSETKIKKPSGKETRSRIRIKTMNDITADSRDNETHNSKDETQIANKSRKRIIIKSTPDKSPPRREILSIWKQNMANKLEKSNSSKLRSENRNQIRQKDLSNERDISSKVLMKQTSSCSFRDGLNSPNMNSKKYEKITSLMENNSNVKRDNSLKSYLIKNFRNRLQSEFLANLPTTVESKTSITDINDKTNLETLIQNTVLTMHKKEEIDTSISNENLLLTRKRPKLLSSRESNMEGRFYLTSSISVGSPKQWPSIKDLSASNKTNTTVDDNSASMAHTTQNFLIKKLIKKYNA